MTREEAIEEIKRWTPILLTSGQCTEETSKAQDMAISALSAEEISEDGTLKVNVSDGSKVKRVLVWGDNIFGGLYYPDSAEGEYIKKEDVIKAFDPYRGYLSRSNDTKFVEDLKNLPTVSFPEREKGTDFPQAKDIEPTIESFKKVLDNRLIREALEEPYKAESEE